MKVKSKLNRKFFPVSKPNITKKDIKNITTSLKNGWISSDGPEVVKFEKKFSQYIKRKYSVAVSSGTAALEIAIKALGIKKGDEVLVPNFTIISNVLEISSFASVKSFRALSLSGCLTFCSIRASVKL